MAKVDPSQFRNSNRSTQNLKQVITSARGPLCKISCKSVRWRLSSNYWNCRIIVYVYFYFFFFNYFVVLPVMVNKDFHSENFSVIIYIYLFCWPTYRSDRSADFHARRLKRRGLTQGCAFV